MSFKLPDIGFDYDALEPYIDGETMEIHHQKHHANYLKKFNEAISKTDLQDKTVQQIFASVSEYNTSIRNNGGGFYNHSLFWQLITPHPSGNIDTELADAITKYFGTIEKLKEEFSTTAAAQFGSGWTWLIKKEDNQLLVTSTPNQDNPLMDIAPIRGIPILCIDMWEHAYYLKYQNNKLDYINAFWNIVNWGRVAELYKQKPI